MSNSITPCHYKASYSHKDTPPQRHFLHSIRQAKKGPKKPVAIEDVPRNQGVAAYIAIALIFHAKHHERWLCSKAVGIVCILPSAAIMEV